MNIDLGTPALLPGLLLLAAPLLVHLLARARPRPYPISSVRLLQKIQRRSARLRRPRDWLLLLLRTLLVAAILGVFLRPVLYLAGLPGDRPRSVVLLVDASASMRATEAGRSRFAAATAEAAQVLDGLRTRDKANVVWLRHPPQSVFSEPGINHRFLKETLRRTEPSWERAAVGAGLRLALDQLKASEGRKEIVWISDFQATNLPETMPDLPPDVILTRLRIGAAVLPNHAVTDLRLDPPRPLAGEDAVVLCEVAQLAETPDRLEVGVEVGPEIHRREISLDPWARELLAIPVRMPAEGPVTLRAWLDPDGAPADDERRLVARLTDRLRVGVLGEPAEPWLRALRALSWVEPQVQPGPGDLGAGGFDALILLAADEDSLAAARRARDRSTLVILAPEGAPHPGPAALLGTDPDPAPSWSLEREEQALVLRQPEHPVFEVFRAGRHGDPAAAAIRGRYRLAKPPGNAELLIAYADGTPALAWWPAEGERATLLWWNLPLGAAYSDLAGRIEFLPLLGEVLLRGRSARADTGPPLTRLCGDAVTPPTEGAETSDDLAAPGWIHWRQDGEPVARTAVNLAAAESDFRSAELQEDNRAQAVSDGNAWRRAREGHPLAPWCLAAAVLLVILEGLVSRWALADVRDRGEAGGGMNPVLPVPWVVLLGGALIVFAGVTGWWSARGGSRRQRAIIAGLRAAAASLLLIPALNPGHWQREDTARDRHWVLLADASASMDTEDGEQHRWDLTRRELPALADSLSDSDPVETRTFAAQLSAPVDALPERAEGEGSRLVAAVSDLLDDASAQGRSLRGVVLWTDGISAEDPTEAERVALAARAQAVPIHVRHMGGPVREPDLRVEVLEPLLTTFKGQNLRIPVLVQADHLGALRTEVTVVDDQGTERGRESVELTPDPEGRARARLWIDVDASPANVQQYTAACPVWEDETRPDNNRDHCWVQSIDHRLRVLFVEGIPHWDSKFLIQLLRKQDHLDLTTVHRLAEDRYYRVSPESADEEGRETDSPFPEDLQEVDLLLVGKGMEYVLTPERLDQVRGFLQERGGMLLFTRGKPYADTFPELAALEPAAWGPESRLPRRWQPKAGTDGLFGGLMPAVSDPVWGAVKPMAAAHRVTHLRPFAQVLATTVPADASGVGTESIPCLISRRLGLGASVCVNAEGLWTWDFFPERESSRDLYRDLWLGLLQWGISQAAFPPGAAVALHPAGDPPRLGRPYRVKVQTRDPEAAAPTLSLWKGTKHEADLSPVAGRQSGQWEAAVRLTQAGDYHLRAASGEQEAVLPIRLAAPPGERARRSADARLPRLLAELSGGEFWQQDPNAVFRPAPPDKAVDELERGQATWHPAWTLWPLLLAAIGIWLFEWAYRRRSGWL